jgi:hypothetical protein
MKAFRDLRTFLRSANGKERWRIRHSWQTSRPAIGIAGP